MAAGLRSPLFVGLAGGLGPIPPPGSAWTLGALWSITVICARVGTWGLQRTGNGATGSSDATNANSFTVVAGQTIFTSFWAKAGVGADGQIGVGYAFRNSAGTLLGYSFVETTTFPVAWTQFVGNITVPTFAVTATPIVRSFAHLAGIWCVDTLSAFTSGGNFSLAAIKHYFSDYTDYR